MSSSTPLVSDMVQTPTLASLLQAGVHFGHIKSKWHPKMEKYIYTTRGGVHIINLEQTVKMLAKALEYMENLGKQGSLVVFVGTKKQAVVAVAEAAKKTSMPVVTTRWLGGTLTNFTIIRNLIQNFLTIKSTLESTQRDRYTKKEQLILQRKMEKLNTTVGGLVPLTRKPDAMVIVDLKRERTAVAEARKTNTPIIALVDTNVNPEKVQYPIPANDDAVRSIEIILGLLADAYLEGKSQAAAQNLSTQPIPAENLAAQSKEAATV